MRKVASAEGVILGQSFEAVACKSVTTYVPDTPAVYERLTGRVPIDYVGRDLYMVLPMDDSAMERAYKIIKRLIDVASGLAVLAALSISNNLTKPLTDLADTARQIAAGNLELRARTEESSPTGQLEEIDALAVSSNSMTAQLRNLIGSLENRVAERTRQLQVQSKTPCT